MDTSLYVTEVVTSSLVANIELGVVSVAAHAVVYHPFTHSVSPGVIWARVDCRGLFCLKFCCNLTVIGEKMAVQ